MGKKKKRKGTWAGPHLTDFEDELRQRLNENREAFIGPFHSAINELLGLSRNEIDCITPDATDLETYDALVQVVKEASRRNLSQADLKVLIERLGEIAVQIAKRVPSLAALF